ncbi:MAG TPA: polysaccharide deacetylase family protein [Planctomycetota bacterium]|jgi:peptidoglycan/xylan/chitin deacetylase (PgdA/CDA1 family)|nr:polysaccharide deacetylase family protein [Planctomycetota bacterium]
MASRPLLSLGLDLDNLWAYQKIHGDSGWESYPSYLDTLVPILLEVAREHNLRMTVFIVGQDAALERNASVLLALAAAGHEIGNHSFRHEPWFHLYSKSEIESEIRRAEESIEKATGRRPIGFRGPGFSLSPETLRVLIDRGYRYDCSTLPTFLGPLARTYYFWKSRGMSDAEREKRSRLYGTWSDGLQPLHAYSWSVAGRRLLELPVTTMPGPRLPFHLSYLLFLRRYSRAAAWAYFRTSLALCRMNGIAPSYLLHPLDILGGDRVPELAFFPGMDLPTGAKIEFLHEILHHLSSTYRVVTLEEHARLAEAQPQLGVRRVTEELVLD